MNTDDLRAFLVIVQELNLTRASDVLYMSQPAVSRLVVRLEHSVGTTLILRHSHSVALTPAGEIFALRAAKIIDEANDMVCFVRDAASTRLSNSPVLRVGMFYPPAAALIAEVLSSFRAACPGVHMVMVDTTRMGAERALLAESVDVAFLWQPVDGDGLVVHDIWADDRVALVSKNGPFSGEAELSMTDLLDEPYPQILTMSRSWSRYWMLERERNSQGRSLLVNDVTEALRAVAGGRVIGFGPRGLVDFCPVAGIHCVPVPGLSQAMQVVACRQNNSNPFVESFMTLALRIARRDSPEAGFPLGCESQR